MSQIIIDDKTIATKAAKAAKKVCEPGCIGKYETCEMCVKNEHGRNLPKIGKDTVCPIAKYGVKETDIPTDMLSRLRKTPNKMDCIYLCANCQYGFLNEGELKNGYYEIDRSDDDFFNHCLDCPVQAISDGIDEARAEAELET